MPLGRKSKTDRDQVNAHNSQQRLARIQTHIDSLHALSRQGLWGLLTFVLISVVVVYFQDINLLANVSQQTREFLGKPPSAKLINIALAVYSFSALILTLSRLADSTESYRGWAHVGYLTGFYMFYFLANAVRVNSMAVLVSGITILGLEYYSVHSFTAASIRRERTIMKKLSGLPLEDADGGTDDCR
ncbi:MAG: hypothetical protein B6I36_01205 [Desulfobacteraceae bacterium 4572_35.1]|nr:MAG: hypothetical protein B6I36_01205 [Desulfobacteraceae bacterium 4572_35.1]